ncbi:oleate hydratase, partial [Cribrihabitans sp. XS_ASV171]
LHLLPGLTRIRGVLRTRYNQYDSLIAPLTDWLTRHGVRIETGTTVTSVGIEGGPEDRHVSSLTLRSGERIPVAAEDRVFLTLGSMTDGATYGSNTTAPPRAPGPQPSWDLWRALAREIPGMGAPETFCADAGRTGWTSFTVTLPRPEFRDHVEHLTGNPTGTGGLVTIRDSAWLMSFVFFKQPHFRSQPKGTTVFWGYGLRGDRPGDFVAKPMWDATGDEIVDELCGQLRLSDHRAEWFADARVLPCHMPFITS